MENFLSCITSYNFCNVSPVGEMKIKWLHLWCNWCVHALAPKHRETHGCVVSTVATDAQALKHQAISIHNAD